MFIYLDIGPDADLGWDYTMRWFKDGANDGSLRNLGIRDLVVVDLNSILCEKEYFLIDSKSDISCRPQSHCSRRSIWFLK